MACGVNTKELVILESNQQGNLSLQKFFTPYPHRFLHGTVGETEQHHIFRSIERQPRPRRHHKRVLGGEVKRLAVNVHSATAFGYAIDAAVSTALRLALEALGQELQVGGDGRHGRTTRERVDVAQLDALPDTERIAAKQQVQRFA